MIKMAKTTIYTLDVNGKEIKKEIDFYLRFNGRKVTFIRLTEDHTILFGVHNPSVFGEYPDEAFAKELAKRAKEIWLDEFSQEISLTPEFKFWGGPSEYSAYVDIFDIDILHCVQWDNHWRRKHILVHRDILYKRQAEAEAEVAKYSNLHLSCQSSFHSLKAFKKEEHFSYRLDSKDFSMEDLKEKLKAFSESVD